MVFNFKANTTLGKIWKEIDGALKVPDPICRCFHIFTDSVDYGRHGYTEVLLVCNTHCGYFMDLFYSS